MSVSRLDYITKIGVEQMGDLADSLEDQNVLRLENLDTDLRPPQSALDFTVIPSHGGWPFLVDVFPLGFDGPAASKRLLELGKIAATPMVNWGSENSSKYVRLVYANEPIHRLRGVGKRFKDALT